MANRKTAFAQAGLGLAGVVWVAFLLSVTGFFSWLAGNALYGLLAFAAGSLHLFGSEVTARVLAAIGTCVFIASNGVAAALACSGGGACGLIIGVASVIIVLQIAVFRAASAN